MCGYMHAKNFTGMSGPIPQQILGGVFQTESRTIFEKKPLTNLCENPCRKCRKKRRKQSVGYVFEVIFEESPLRVS